MLSVTGSTPETINTSAPPLQSLRHRILRHRRKKKNGETVISLNLPPPVKS
jgi:hypothetical protein